MRYLGSCSIHFLTFYMALTSRSRRTSWQMSSCDASRGERGEPLLKQRTENDVTTRPALGDRKKREVGTPRKACGGKAAHQWWPPEQSYGGEGAAARHFAGPRDRCVLCVTQTLAEICHILEEERMFVLSAAKTMLREPARQIHLPYHRSSHWKWAQVRVAKEWKISAKMSGMANPQKNV